MNNDTPHGVAPDTATGKASGSIVSAQNRFGFALLSRLAKDAPRENVFISPFSVTQALMLAANGAAPGETQNALKKTLQIENMPIGTANRENAALRKDLTAIPPSDGSRPPGIQLIVANALWADKKVALAASYVKTCRAFYGAQASTLDFTQPNASANAINAWISKNTKKRIPTIVEPALFQTPPPVQAVLTNAVYFKARWQKEFEKQETRPAPFTRADGVVKQVPTMQQIGSHAFGYFKGENFAAARLFYDGSASLYVFLPDKGGSVATLLSKMNEANWNRWRTAWDTNVDMDLFLPRFKTEYSAGLVPALGDMGMRPALSPAADFSPMGLKQGFIGGVIHKTYLDINEKGTEASAATAIVMVGSAAGPPPKRKKVVFRVDRPFVIAVVDEQHGAILFLGAIHDPS